VRFQAAHKLVTYLLVLAALATLATTRSLAPGSAMIFLLVCALSFGADTGSRSADWLDRRSGAVRAAMGALLAVIVWRIWRRTPDSDLAPALDLVLALLGYKLCYRRSHRDYVQLYALSFLLVLVASTITATVLFMATFAIYVVLATWALILFHLRREMEENYLVRHSAQAPSQKVGIGRILGSRRVVGRAFFGATFAVAAAVFVGAVAIFTFVPRFGAGFVLGAHAPSNVIGLADEVALGSYGTSGAVSHSVLFRVTSPRLGSLGDLNARRAAAERLYVRGAVYDRYGGGRWIRSRQPELRTVLEEVGDRTFIHEPGDGHGRGPSALAGTDREEIEAVGIPAAVLFAIDRPVALELPATHLGALGSVRVVPRWSGETALGIGGDASDSFVTLSSAHYVGYSDLSDSNAGTRPFGPGVQAIGSSAAFELEPAAREDYLALPTGLRRLSALAGRLGAGRDDGGKVGAVIGWLHAGHSYTLRPPARPGGVDPVEDFLFDQPAGHCELFASAAVLLLRATGVPARYVTGFRGGAWNPIGGYVAVRDERAHAWAEAFVAGAGWIRVDATPPATESAGVSRFAEASDALDFFWSRWVVGYDLGRQRALARGAWRGLARVAPATWARLFGALLGIAALAAFSLVTRRARRRRRPRLAPTGASATRRATEGRPAGGAIDRLYRRTLGRLAGVGWPRRPSETPHEYAERLRGAGLFAAGAFDTLTERYAAARFGGHTPPDEAVAELGRTVLAALAGVAAGEKTGRST
jgi:protein-glutamine gamma-glutamyltransferase